jgi:hypothetical protein
MSLIVARKEALSIIIVSDTKLSMPKERQGDRGDKIGLPSSGVIKTAIINSDTAISFAGGEDHAEEALQRIKDSTSLSDILAILLQAHLESCEATDFIVAVGGLAPTLYVKWRLLGLALGMPFHYSKPLCKGQSRAKEATLSLLSLPGRLALPRLHCYLRQWIM